jgi:hypothetical protein
MLVLASIIKTELSNFVLGAVFAVLGAKKEQQYYHFQIISTRLLRLGQ